MERGVYERWSKGKKVLVFRDPGRGQRSEQMRPKLAIICFAGIMIHPARDPRKVRTKSSLRNLLVCLNRAWQGFTKFSSCTLHGP
jgi:hypothetical protein